MSRAVTTDWMLKELDAPHEQIVIDYTTGENNTATYRSINPMGKIPALVDDDAVVTETAAICAYLADKFSEKGLAPPLNSTERGRYYRYLFFPGTTLEPMFTFKQLGHADPEPNSTGWGDRERCLASMEAMTPESDWALHKQFTAADVVFGGTLDFAIQFGWLKEPSERVNAYVQRLRQRPAYRATHPESWYQ
jgi:glutathione S-transferase